MTNSRSSRAYRDRDQRGVGAGSAARPAPRPGRLPCEARRAGLGQPALAARRRPRRPFALGDAVRGRDAAQGAHLGALPRPAPSLPVPVPQRLGEPSALFPRPWIVTTWVPGEPADRAPVTRAAEAADTLAAFLTALHQPAPEQAPPAPWPAPPRSEKASRADALERAGVAVSD
nr:phosphotransferase [Nonomuraea muscovyensis]